MNTRGETEMLLPLQKGILYGPVHSRRYGRSLGINLMPSEYKLCSFNCVYCHFGWTKKRSTDVTKFADDLPAFKDVVREVEKAMKSATSFDLITFSGNGEPTLYPRFTELVDEVVRLRDIHRPAVKVALLSNSSGVMSEPVRRGLSKIDLPVFKLDAGAEKTFKLINRPAKEIRFETVVANLTSLNDICLQTVFVDGTPSNTSEEELSAYLEKVARIRPREVHIYSIDRPVPDTEIVLVSPETLQEIARRGHSETGVTFRPFYRRQNRP